MGEQQQMFDFTESPDNKLMKTNQINVVDTWINAKKANKAHKKMSSNIIQKYQLSG